MPAERYYHSSPFAPGGEITLETNEARHLVSVMRGNPGDCVELFDGRGHLAQGQVSTIHKKRGVTIEIQSVSFEALPVRTMTLYQAIPRSNRLDTILEKTTELGVTTIILFPGARSERSNLAPNQQARAQKVVVAAAKQCGRLWLPRIELAGPIGSWDPMDGDIFFGDIDASAPRLRNIEIDKERPVGLVVGPESGLTHEEEKVLRASGAIGVSLNHNILRTDTAAIVGVALLA
ncbi:hypothetical protein SCG7086_AO_00010 [Chlamydiales bacterium SCGC AG-110-P3]|nr:hypothetical protein SCG7086_AO_00010 [Chlamydiales bacterium SCGC AG-110-P3]